MLDLVFIVPLKRIVKLIPVKRQTFFFSATCKDDRAAGGRASHRSGESL